MTNSARPSLRGAGAVCLKTLRFGVALVTGHRCLCSLISSRARPKVLFGPFSYKKKDGAQKIMVEK